MTSEFLNVSAAARQLGVSHPTMRRLLRAGAIPARRITDRIVRIRRSDLDAYIARCDGHSASGLAA